MISTEQIPFRDLVEFSPDALVVSDREGKIALVNAHAEELFGYTRLELLDKHVEDLIPGYLSQSAAAGAVPGSALRHSHQAVTSLKRCGKRKNHDNIPLEIRQKQLATGQGPLFLSALRKVSEWELPEVSQTARFKELVDFKAALDLHAILAITNTQGIITYVNDKFCQVSKYSRLELLGQSHRLLNSGQHSQEFFRDLWTTISSGEVWQGEIRNRAKDGTFYWVDATIVPFLGLDGHPTQYVAIRTEITERKRAEEDRERLIAELKQALAEVRTLSGMLPICSSCKKVRDDHGYWSQIEVYVSARTHAQFSHGICPNCTVKAYREAGLEVPENVLKEAQKHPQGENSCVRP